MELRQFPCKNCGADLAFAPGTSALACPYCGTENEIAVGEVQVRELDFAEATRTLAGQMETVEILTVKCSNCGAETTLDPNVTADVCAFCGTALVLEGASQRMIRPEGVLPFAVQRGEAQQAFSGWLKSRWFAPSALKQHSSSADRLAGLYVPHWTYDANTVTTYTGRRGDHYYTTESYTAMQNGRPVQRTRQQQHTRWSGARGRVHVSFDDVLVAASETLPEVYRPRLGPAELKQVVPYADEYLTGFRTEHYSIGLEDGFRNACDHMQPTIDQTIRSDIGGDVQQILHKDTRYHDVTFKHILVPLWISTYRFKGKPFRFTVDARTGAVQGERPYSAIKIALAVIAVFLLVMLFVMFSQGQ